MKFIEISKPLVTSILSESILLEGKDGKNTHLEHLEDNILNKGYPGAKEAVDYLYSLHSMLDGNAKSPISMTTKWDGAPAIVAGKDPATGKFFVGTKGVFAQKPKINFTNKDIDVNHADQGEKDGSGLRTKLKLALKYLSRLNWDTVAQGDMLFATKEDIKTVTLDNEEHIIFKPNTITYAVPKNSDMAKQILSAGFGIVWHTEYVGGPTLADTNASFGFDSSVLGQATGVWHRDALIKDLSGTVTMTAEQSDDILNAITVANEYLKTVDADTFKWLQQGTDLIGDKVFLPQLKAHVNNQVRQGHFDEPTKFAQDFVTKYINYMEKEIAKVKTQKSIDSKTEKMVQGVKFIKEHVPSIVAVYELY